jgi:hypothetical protein
MINIKAHIDNSGFTEEAGVNLYKEIIKAVAISTEYARKVAREDMRKPKTGNIYKILGVDHQASAPGESPAVLTGTLINGLSTSMTASPMMITGQVATSPDAFYAGFLDEQLDRPIYRNIESAAEHFFITQLESIFTRIQN